MQAFRFTESANQRLLLTFARSIIKLMRSIVHTLAVLVILQMFSCSTEVDNYADYKDITIVYGLLESKADTNFIKITKAFLG